MKYKKKKNEKNTGESFIFFKRPTDAKESVIYLMGAKEHSAKKRTEKIWGNVG